LTSSVIEADPVTRSIVRPIKGFSERRGGEYDVIVSHELSRLWRSESEMHAIKEELEYLNVHVVADDRIDARIVGMDILIAVKGAMAKQELRQIAHRTHRALKGLALDGRSAGGKCYGYIAATKSVSGKREIDEVQAREVQGYVCATRVNGGLHACSNRLRLPRVRLEQLLQRWVHSVLIGAEAEHCLLRAWRARSGGNSPGTEYIAPLRDDGVQELRDEISNLVNAIAHGALRSSPALADRLAEAELKLVAETGSAAVDGGAGRDSGPKIIGILRAIPDRDFSAIPGEFTRDSHDAG
jgi:hypothetical protein